MQSEPALEVVDIEVRGQSYAAMGGDVAILDDIILNLNQGLVRLNDSKHDRGLNFLAMLLLTRALNSTWRSRGCCERLSAFQSMMLTRAVLEDWGTIVYVEQHPEAAGLWLRGILPEAQQTGRVRQLEPRCGRALLGDVRHCRRGL